MVKEENKVMIDFSVENRGSIILFWPLTDAAREWLNFNCVNEPWQWFGDALSVEPRMAPDVYDGLITDGFTVFEPLT